MRMWKGVRMVTLGCALLVAGCMTVGGPFPVREVPEIQVGVTTKQDLLDRFGAPYRTGYDDGDRTWTWVHYELSLFGDQRSRDLYVRFGADGRVKSYSFNTNFAEDEPAPGAR